ncbi:hypothetical protein HHI36_015186 [Cryptolaemus montrouzieri]|uniref:Maturase K n=1 Tax=Cryptolaemus montrouzieri TaxID=559131 RepID=A0ABD2N5E1_9CUCU
MQRWKQHFFDWHKWNFNDVFSTQSEPMSHRPASIGILVAGIVVSHKHIKHMFFVYPVCIPLKRVITFKSAQIFQRWSSYFTKSRIFFNDS